MTWRRRKSREHDLERELRAHLDLETAEHLEAGLPPEAAHYAAQRALGNTALLKEEVREMWGWTRFEQFWQDLLRDSHLRQEPRLHAGRRSDAGIRHRSHVCHLQRSLWRPAP
jgi:hypothetical protein